MWSNLEVTLDTASVGGTPLGSTFSVKEMVPIIMAVAIWGKSWKGSSVRLSSDSAVVAAINSNTSRVRDSTPSLMPGIHNGSLAMSCVGSACTGNL